MKDAKNSRLRLVLGSLILLVVAVGLVGLMEFSDRGNESPEQTMPEDEIYVCIPRRFGAVDQDPHWWTSFDALGLQSLQDLSRLPIAESELDPWSQETRAPGYLFLVPGDGSAEWSIGVGYGFVSVHVFGGVHVFEGVRVGETKTLYYDTLDLEAQLLRQGVEQGWFEDMQQIYRDRDLSEYIQ